MALQSLLGDTLVKNDGTEVKTSELSTNEGGVVGIYFSAHWCPPCRGFTPRLVDFYKECKEAGKTFEVVFVSSDRNQEEFDGYFREMPWLALRFSHRDLKSKLSGMFSVTGIPTLILLDGKGEVISTDGRGLVGKGVENLPFPSL